MLVYSYKLIKDVILHRINVIRVMYEILQKKNVHYFGQLRFTL